MQHADAAGLLKGFAFKESCGLGQVLARDFNLDIVTGVVEMDGFLPGRDLVWPGGASHCGLRLCRIGVDFESG